MTVAKLAHRHQSSYASLSKKASECISQNVKLFIEGFWSIKSILTTWMYHLRISSKRKTKKEKKKERPTSCSDAFDTLRYTGSFHDRRNTWGETKTCNYTINISSLCNMILWLTLVSTSIKKQHKTNSNKFNTISGWNEDLLFCCSFNVTLNCYTL